MGRIKIARGFLGRLARDVRGNTIALMAAAMLPLAGLIGGGVDMSRLYLTKTRLQQACDAGALAGRKAMAAGSWTTGSGSTKEKAERMFAANFAQGNYGTGTLTKDFTESNGIVSGTAQVPVPMTIMKVFGMRSRQVSVTCTAKMELPNTDVMFVLDVTYSMQCAPAATSDACTPASAGSQRIDGLKKAVKCFYEALERVATPEPCTYNSSNNTYNSTGDPTATTATTTAQVRLGFVPYGVNVNVGKILPNQYVADNWTFQSRVANTYSSTLYGWTLGAESGISGWGSLPATPTDRNNQSTYSGWSNVSGTGSITINGTSYAKSPGGKNSTTCPALNTIGPSGNRMLEFVDTNNGLQTPDLVGTTNNPPTYPAAQQVLSYTQDEDHSVAGYKYVWNSGSSTCRLQQGSRSYSLTRTGGQSTKAISWTPYSGVFKDWTYRAVSLPVSGLKVTGSTWNNSVAIPNLTLTTGPTVKLSGSNSSTTIQYPASLTVDWDGCIEEAHTFQNTDGDPSDDWATMPTDAYDMNVNLIPSGSTAYNSYWGPMLDGAVWARYSGGSSSWTTSNITTTSSLVQNNYSYICTTSAARKLTEYRTATNFLSYVNGLAATDLGTYHDIGMLWGARLISPLGIFASENAQAATGGAIQRHLIFMTDGNTRTVHNNYNAYGLSYFNRYQTSYDPSETQTDNLTNARLINLCNQIKNMNITLWVVSYGSAVNTTTQDRLRACATDTSHFVMATDTATLTSQFQQIAAKISELRLTS